LYFTHFLCPGYSSFNAPATRELYPLSLHDALPILPMVLDVAGVAGIGTTRIRRRATAILAGQHATPQRSPRQQPDPVTPGRGHDLAFDPAFQQRVLRLHRDDRIRPALLDLGRGGQLPPGVVAHAEVPDLARRHRMVGRRQRLLQRSFVVPDVDLPQVDVVHL